MSKDVWTVKDLKEWLEGADDDAIIRVAAQPHYPMEASFMGLAEAMVANEVWICVGGNIGYDVPPDIHQAAENGWR